MTTTILVPLDGSPLAEKILPYIPALYKGKDVELLLVSVLEVNRYAAALGSDNLFTFDLDGWRREAQRYLDGKASELNAAGVAAQTLVLQGDVAGKICDTAEIRDVDLIAMTTHGHSGLKLRFLGSVADRIVRTADRPILIMRPESDTATGAFERILVPLDGSILAEEALPLALEHLRSSEGELLLVQAVEALDFRVVAHAEYYGTPSLPSTAEIEMAAKVYLENVAEPLRRSGLTISTRVAGGPAAQTVADIATEEEVDLVVMSTHGRSGVSRWVFGSVAEKIIRLASCPVLLIPTRRQSERVDDTVGVVYSPTPI